MALRQPAARPHPTVRIGVVGYGTGGRHFHTPFIRAAEGAELAGIVARSPERVAQANADYPDVPVFDSLAALIDSGVDAVTITTPPTTRRALVLEALGRGVHVVADKPFAPSAAVGQELADAAAEAGLVLSVFHNRRQDADIQTVAGVLKRGQLGELWRVYSRLEFDDPRTLETGSGGGLLRDLGSHLVDQMLWLLGPVTQVYAALDHTDRFGERTDCGFDITLRHASGVVSHVSSSKLNHVTSREFRLYGSSGSYVSSGTDVQAQAIFAGKRPIDDAGGWGYEAEERWGTLSREGVERRIPSAQGDYSRFYTAFAAAVRGDGPNPVPAAEGIATLRVLDAARLSDAERRAVDLA